MSLTVWAPGTLPVRAVPIPSLPVAVAVAVAVAVLNDYNYGGANDGSHASALPPAPKLSVGPGNSKATCWSEPRNLWRDKQHSSCSEIETFESSSGVQAIFFGPISILTEILQFT